MANKQINELSEITSISESDLLVVYDADEGGSEKTKKILKSNFLPYEEGLWTPEIADALTGGNTGTATTAAGRYTKIGDTVTITVTLVTINTAGMTGGNIFYVRNLPFTPSFTGDPYATATPYVNKITWVGDYLMVYNINVEAMHLREISNNGYGDSVTVSQLTSGAASVVFTITYFTA